jgi:hypothetical protein
MNPLKEIHEDLSYNIHSDAAAFGRRKPMLMASTGAMIQIVLFFVFMGVLIESYPFAVAAHLP